MTTCDPSCGKCDFDGNCLVCVIGKYLENSECKNCHPKCLTCTDDKTTCQTCSINGLGRSTYIEDNCACLEGYYEGEESIDCIKCSSNCKSCD